MPSVLFSGRADLALGPGHQISRRETRRHPGKVDDWLHIYEYYSSTVWIIFVAFTCITPFIPSQRGDLPCIVSSRGTISIRDVASVYREGMIKRTHAFLQSR